MLMNCDVLQKQNSTYPDNSAIYRIRELEYARIPFHGAVCIAFSLNLIASILKTSSRFFRCYFLPLAVQLRVLIA